MFLRIVGAGAYPADMTWQYLTCA